MKEANFEMLIEMCKSVGWDKGIKALENQTQILENKQAYLFGGSPAEVKQAIKLSQIIIKQNLAVANLKKYKRENIDKKPAERAERRER